MPLVHSYLQGSLEERVSSFQRNRQVVIRNFHKVMQQAAVDLLQGRRDSACLNLGLNVTTMDPGVLNMIPTVFLRQAELYDLRATAIATGQNFGSIHLARFMGVNYADVDARFLNHLSIRPGGTIDKARFFGHLGSPQICDEILSARIQLPPEVITEIDAKILPDIEAQPLFPADRIHFSDPFGDPLDPHAQAIPIDQREQLKLWMHLQAEIPAIQKTPFSIAALGSAIREHIKIRMPLAFQSPQTKFFWEKLQSIPSRDIPNKGSFFTLDAVEDLAALQEKAQLIALNHMDPRILTSERASLAEDHGHFQRWMVEFAGKVLQQISPNGKLILSVGAGNNAKEGVERAVTFEAVARALLLAGANVVTLHNTAKGGDSPTCRTLLDTAKTESEAAFLSTQISYGALVAELPRARATEEVIQDFLEAGLPSESWKQAIKSAHQKQEISYADTVNTASNPSKHRHHKRR